MVTLKELTDTQVLTGMSDIRIIKTFFDINNMEEEGMDLITELSKIKIEKLKRKEDMVVIWSSNLPSRYLYEEYDLKTADKLHTLELDYISHGGELSKKRLEWARENVPNIVRPEIYFNPLVDWLKENEIEFKER